MAHTQEGSYPDFNQPLETARDAIVAYHTRPDADTQLPPRTAKRVIELLSDSTIVWQMLDAAWAAVDLSQHKETEPHEAEDLLSIAESKWRKVATRLPGKERWVSAETGLAFLPVFRAAIGAEDPHSIIDWAGLNDRLAEVNQKFLDTVDAPRWPTKAAAAELAVFGLFAHVGKTVMDPSSPLAWPASSWQERRWKPDKAHSEHPEVSFGIRFGRFPEGKTGEGDPGRARVIPGLGGPDNSAKRAELRAQYDPTIRLLFGNVHVGNTPRDPFLANRALVDSDLGQLQSMTRAVFGALGLPIPESGPKN